MTIDKVICDNVDTVFPTNRQFACQNILAQLRNLVEQTAIKIIFDGQNVDPLNYETVKNAMRKIKESSNDIKFIVSLHSLLQISESHYTIGPDSSERLMISYLGYLLKLKKLMKCRFDMDILRNIGDISFTNDPDCREYYEKAAGVVDRYVGKATADISTDRYYVQRIRPFCVGDNVYYEITFQNVIGGSGKYDRMTAFTNQEITDNYAVKLDLIEDTIKILGTDVSIWIIRSWTVSIRPCEIKHLSEIFGLDVEADGRDTEYKLLTAYLTYSQYNLLDIVCLPSYYNTLDSIFGDSKPRDIRTLLDYCRDLIIEKKPGCNIVRYLLYFTRNDIIKNQWSPTYSSLLSNLYLRNGCIPFDNMPFCSSLLRHNPAAQDLVKCIDTSDREYEFLAKMVDSYSVKNKVIFVPLSELDERGNIRQLMSEYNSRLYLRHDGRKLLIYSHFIYIKGYLDTLNEIIQRIRHYTASGIPNYSNSVDNWMKNSGYSIDSDEKRDIFRRLFSSSKVAFIYGSAGTGKSTIINHISVFFKDVQKLYLADTNAAVNNLKRKIYTSNTSFSTISKYLSSKKYNKYDLIFIDECSTVSNDDMRDILLINNCKLLVLTGDVHQIESIKFGNWFDVVKSFIPSCSVFELSEVYRSDDKILRDIWGYVRDNKPGILELLNKYSISSELNKSVFDTSNEDQIILCLNYNGLYGINNFNHILQCSNKNEPVKWGLKEYKVGDPVLFNDSNRFSPLIYNNMKGIIKGIQLQDDHIQFDIEIDAAINGFDATKYGITVLESQFNVKSTIRFTVNKSGNSDADDNSIDSAVPFSIAYAVSIHKSQGLEYNSVKVVLSDDVEELVTRNIFYTAITRAKNKLKIYWSLKTENAVLNSFKDSDKNRDVQLLRAMN